MKTHNSKTSFDGSQTFASVSRPLTASSSWSQNNRASRKANPRPATASTFTSRQQLGASQKISPRMCEENATRKSILDLTYSGDYLDRHQDRFQNTENMPFQPKIKKRHTKSFLSQSKHYAPPTQPVKKKDDSSTSLNSKKYKELTKEDIEAVDYSDRYLYVTLG